MTITRISQTLTQVTSLDLENLSATWPAVAEKRKNGRMKIPPQTATICSLETLPREKAFIVIKMTNAFLKMLSLKAPKNCVQKSGENRESLSKFLLTFIPGAPCYGQSLDSIGWIISQLLTLRLWPSELTDPLCAARGNLFLIQRHTIWENARISRGRRRLALLASVAAVARSKKARKKVTSSWLFYGVWNPAATYSPTQLLTQYHWR